MSAEPVIRAESPGEFFFVASLLDELPSAIFVKDARDLRFVAVNKALERLVGRSREEILGRTDRDLFPAEIAALYNDDDRAVIRSKSSLDIPEEPFESNGRRCMLHTRKTVLLDQNGEPRFLLGVTDDVTESRRRFDRLAGERKMESIGQLAAGVAHEFNNLLTSVLIAAELIRANAEDARLVRECSSDVAVGARRGGELTRKLMAFSQQERLSPEDVSLNGRIESAAPSLRSMLGERCVLHLALASDVPRVHLDPLGIDQILACLVGNAREAMPTGGTLIVRTQRVSVAAECAGVSGAAPGTYATLEIADDGVGMDETVRARLFQPFFTTKSRANAAGLGLAAVYGLVKKSGGYIEVDSAPGRGSTFRLFFPALEGPVSPGREAAGAAAAGPSAGAKTVLIAEDEAGIRRLTRRVLEGEGYRVLEARDGQEAWELMQSPDASVDLLISDIIMPRLQGDELAKRAAEIAPSLKILFMSGYHNEDGVDASAVLGRPFLSKPFAPGALVKAVRDAFRA